MDYLSIDGQKLAYHPERVAQWMSAKTIDEKMRVFPLYVEVSPVGHCNHRCTFCAVDYIGYKPRAIHPDVMKRTLQSMAENGVKSVMYAGEGEPLLHKHIGTIVDYTKQFGIDVAFTTNGVLLDIAFVEHHLQNISWIKVSCNGGDPETYAKVHQTKPEDFYKVLRNLSYAATMKDINNLGVKLGLQMVVLPENISSAEELIIDAVSAGADYVVLKPYSQHTSSINKYEIDYNKWDKVLTEMAERHTNERFSVIYRRESALKKSAGYQKCYSTPFMWAYIMATGDVYACSAYLLNERFNLGNINEQSFEQIWLGNKRRRLIEYVENELDISDCRLNCRMDKSNEYQWRLKNPMEHDNFI